LVSVIDEAATGTVVQNAKMVSTTFTKTGSEIVHQIQIIDEFGNILAYNIVTADIGTNVTTGLSPLSNTEEANADCTFCQSNGAKVVTPAACRAMLAVYNKAGRTTANETAMGIICREPEATNDIITDMMRILLSTDWTNQQVSDFLQDISANPDTRTGIYQNVRSLRAWKLVKYANSSQPYHLDVDVLNVVMAILNSSDAMDCLNGETELQNIIRANNEAPCSKCATDVMTDNGRRRLRTRNSMAEYLKDVAYFCRYSLRSINGVNRVIRDIKSSSWATVEGATFLLRVLRANTTYLNRTSGFEQWIEITGTMVSRRRADVYLDNRIYVDAKSWTSGSVQSEFQVGIGSFNQLCDYIRAIQTWNSLEYWFDNRKLPPRDRFLYELQLQFSNPT
jgi:hypothetical protein